MGIHIETEEADRLARQLANLTGESAEEAVTQALRERVERLLGDDRLERMMAIAGELAPLLKDSPSIEELLYDENGLPK